jgi:hypothetical protein
VNHHRVDQIRSDLLLRARRKVAIIKFIYMDEKNIDKMEWRSFYDKEQIED